jgi:menaquinone-dependent protoporphyrinogen oxidase
MSRILVLYGTSEGHTAKVARAIAARLAASGVDADVQEAVIGDPLPAAYDGVVVAASLHAGGYQKAVSKWLRNHAKEFGPRPTAFVSVCLAVLSRDEKTRDEARAIPHRYVDRLGWQPTMIKVVAGALPYTKYNFFVRWMMKRIVAGAGGDTDTSRDYEYTDWQDLRAFADRFAAIVKVRRDAA